MTFSPRARGLTWWGPARVKALPAGSSATAFTAPMAHGSSTTAAPVPWEQKGPARVFKGRRLPGHLGAARVTVQNLEVVRVDGDRNLLAVKGAIPGPKGGLVLVKPSTKNRG